MYGKTIQEIKEARLAKESEVHKNPNTMISSYIGEEVQPTSESVKKKVRKASKQK